MSAQPELHSNSYIKRPKNAKIHRFFAIFFGLFSKYLVPSGAKYLEKGFGRYKNWRGVIDKPILKLLTFGQKVTNFVNAGFWRLKATETSIWAPEGAFGPKKASFPVFVHDVFELFCE